MSNEILNELLSQEDEIQFHYFNNATAWELGSFIKTAAEDMSVAVAIEVYAFGQVVFSYAMPGLSLIHI